MHVATPAVGDPGLCGLEQTGRRPWIAMREDRIPRLVEAVARERQPRLRTVELERVLAGRGPARIVAEQRPVAALRRGLLLIHPVTQVEAVGDARAVRDDQRRPVE